MALEIKSQKPDYKTAGIPRKIGRAVCDVVLPTYITYPWRQQARHSYPREDYDNRRAFFGGTLPSFFQALSEPLGVGMLASMTTGSGVRDVALFLAGTHAIGKAVEGVTHVVERTVWQKKTTENLR